VSKSVLQEPVPTFTNEDWLDLFTQNDDMGHDNGALTKREIMERKGWTYFRATVEVRRQVKSGRLTWVKALRDGCGGVQRVIAYIPTRKALDKNTIL
jgi:hypothetical protein